MTLRRLLVAANAAVVAAQVPSISPENEVPPWAADSTMQLSLSSTGGDVLPLDYTVIPSTENLGLNQSEVVRGAIRIEGVMVVANPSNYYLINGSSQIAYLSCDVDESMGATTPDIMLIDLMENRPKAIVLYSTVENWCHLSGSDLPYRSIFTMADAGDASQAFEILNNTNEADSIQVTITGNATSNGSKRRESNGNDSAIAMSILYSITGLITLLFLVIIAAGAIRAHRYPERYGPRSGHGGRPRQSRAKGLARAVLETLPIVKFGAPEPAKPDPNLELESASIDHPMRNRATDAGATGAEERDEEDRREAVAQGRAIDGEPGAAMARHDSAAGRPGGNTADSQTIGCSICTDDFKLGEDVRVLPCSHKFHPPCIDPWLINVSGTCPLWYALPSFAVQFSFSSFSFSV
ncbi:hypothetical protein SODALDRAFT_92952 [Sodiomyces alkalinus F11]|uniref:RING-type domain-containing protein n=1 Tax=Sodiomyces alkalinus (strain CBS 110278 / VKM F-3762 / F11) TaxID=1314773 RepID=A0A3N2Q0Q8_SODAK|nr:hypothetical protein SODALDRAFT_92952 [Sodiomyces alkalinus F11]ROT40286.1 hypothetical protein SODALDRAFT_92952 [Sodiomyces alkalinus F11]